MEVFKSLDKGMRILALAGLWLVLGIAVVPLVLVAVLGPLGIALSPLTISVVSLVLALLIVGWLA